MKKIALLLLALLLPTPAAAGVTCSLPFNLQNGQTADATQVMANYNALVTCLGNAAAAGANSDITALLGLTTPLSYSSGGSSAYLGGTSTGSGNAQIVSTLVPTGFTLTPGKSAIFIAGFSNSGATQFNINGTGLLNVYRQAPAGPKALTGGEIVAGQLVQTFYDGTQYQLLSVSNQSGGIGTQTSIVAATTTDLSTIPNHNALITGGTTITSFGANADVNFPSYRIIFSGSLTLTYNATSMILPGAANIVTQANDSATAIYLGTGNWQLVDYVPASGSSVIASTPQCGMTRLVITNNSGTPNTNIDVTASSATMLNASGVPKTINTVSFTINTTTGTGTSAANGMDGESRPTSAPTYLYVISDGTVAAGLGSTSSTAPTLPSGYTYKCYAGAMITDGSANFYRTRQAGGRTSYSVQGSGNTTSMRLLDTGPKGATSGTYVSVSLTGFTPATATGVFGTVTAASSISMVAPNSNYGAYNSTTNPPVAVAISAADAAVVPFNFLLESAAISWASSAGKLYVSGWSDAVNAN